MAKQEASRQEPEPSILAIAEEFITLGQLLKMVGVIGSGGEAKYYLAEQQVLVNGEIDQRRGRKLRPGDNVLLPDGQAFCLAQAEESDPPTADN